MGLAVRIENARRTISPHSASSVLVADTFDGNAFFEIGMKRYGRGGVARSLENVDPAIFEALETLHVIGCIGELDAIAGVVGNLFGFVGVARVSRGMRAAKPRLTVLDGEWRRVVQ